MGKSYTDEQFNQLVEHVKFSNLQKNKMVNLAKNDCGKNIFKKDNFLREGKSQAWHSLFTPELNVKANRWIEENLKNTDLRFPFIDIYS